MANLSYSDAGVSLDKSEQLISSIKPLAKDTHREGVLSGIGGFAALFEVSSKKFHEPILVSGTDGVGTKLKIALAMNQHQTIGIDLVAMCVNDILTQGAEPLFFLDYFSCGQLHLDNAKNVISGIVNGCKMAGCALIGGETAEMPGMYLGEEYDLAGFAVGAVEKSKIITGKAIEDGDYILGLASSGLHSNGFSLVRKIIDLEKTDLHIKFSDADHRSLGEVLLEPTRIYVSSILHLLQNISIKGIAHITGGGLIENIPRILPLGLGVELDGGSWPRPIIFDWLSKQGKISEEEMHRAFNCGIGMILVVSKDQLDATVKCLSDFGEKVWKIGRVSSLQKENDRKRVKII